VVEGPLTISVTEAGTIQPRDQIIIKSEVEGTTTILSLMPEGTHVKKGELLVELDASKLQDAKVDQEIRVQNAEAAFIRARENLEVVRNQGQSDVEQAELTLRFGGEDLKKYKEGEYPNQVKELQARVTLAQEELQRAQHRLRWSRTLFQEKYLSETELKADELAASKAKLELELANNNLALLKEYTHKRRLDELQSAVKQAKMARERTQRKAAADLVQAQAELKAKQAEFTRERSKLKKIESQIAKTRLLAPAAGLVVYATSAKVSSPRHGVEPLAEGQQVRERQELIYLPTGSAFLATVSVHESSLRKIRPGLPVRITVDALPGRTFEGTIASIAPLPDAQSMWMNPDLKVYETQIHISGGADVLRSSMTCKAEIIVASYPAALHVPIQSVVRVNGRPTVFVQQGNSPEARTVELGMDNGRMIHIVSGLRAGESVVLTPSLEASVAESRPATAVASADQPPAAAPPAAPPQQTRPSPGPGGRPDLTPQERQKRSERLKNLPPEQREAIRRKSQQARQQAGGERPGGTP